MAKKVRPIPKGYHSVSPALNSSDAKSVVAFCKKVFGATLVEEMRGPDGKIIHAALAVGDSVIMVSDAIMEPERPGNVFVYVENVDKAVTKAVKLGAKVLTAAEDMFWGDRFARVEDALGNRWGFGRHIEDVTPKELKKRMAAMKPDSA